MSAGALDVVCTCARQAGRWGEHVGERLGERAPAAPAGVGSAAFSAIWPFWLAWLSRAATAPIELRLLADRRPILPKAPRKCENSGTEYALIPMQVRGRAMPA